MLGVLILGAFSICLFTSSVLGEDEVQGEWENHRNITGLEEFKSMQFYHTDEVQNQITIQTGSSVTNWDFLLTHKKETLPGGGNCFDISDDGKYIAIGSSGWMTGVVMRIVRLSNMSIEKEFTLEDFGSVTRVDWFHDGTRLVVGQSSNKVDILSIENWTVTHSWDFQKQRLLDIEVAPNDEYVAIALPNNTVIFDGQNGSEIHRMTGSLPFELSWSYDSKYLAIPSGYSTFSMVYAVEMWEEVWTAGDYGYLLVFSPRSYDMLITPGGRRVIKIVDIFNETDLFSYRYSDEPVRQIRWNHNGSVFGVAFSDRLIRIFFNSTYFPHIVPSSVRILSPRNDTAVLGETVVHGVASHPYGIQYVILQVDTDPWRIANGTETWGLSYNFSDYAEGNHRITAYSSNGFQLSPPHVIYVSVVGPTTQPSKPVVEITYPQDISTISDSIFITGTADGPISINYVELKIDDGSWHMASGTNDWRYFLDIDDLEGGHHRIHARSKDSRFTSNVTSISIVLERHVNPKPVIELTEPELQSELEGVVTIKGVATDSDGILSVQYSIENVSTIWVDTTGTTDWSFVLNTTLLENRPVTIYMRVTDRRYGSSTYGFQWLVNNPEHHVGIEITFPPYNFTTVYGTITMTGRFENVAILGEAFLYIDDFGKEIVANGSTWSVDIDTEGFENGNHTVRVTAMSSNGLLTYTEITIDIQNINTRPNVFVRSPMNNSKMGSNFFIEGNANDDLFVETVQCSIDGGKWIGCNGTTEWSIFIDISEFDSGTHTVSIRGYDGYVYSEPATLELTFDKGSVESPSDPILLYVLVTILSVVITGLVIYILRNQK